MSPSSSSRHRGTARKLALTAAAVAVTLLPTACDYASAGQSSYGSSTTVPTFGSENGGHAGHGAPTTDPVVVPVGNTVETTPAAAPSESADPTATAGATESTETTTAETTAPETSTPTSAPPANTPPANNGLEILGNDCAGSTLEPHDGFQLAPRCISTAFGEVAAADQSPSLLITKAPRAVKAGKTFTISVSTRNLVRDRFLGAAAGGYYLESSFLDPNGLQRGHFHTACRMLESTDTAPDATPAPAFFLATQDNQGGAAPDTVTITVTGLSTTGTAQCAVWAGDGSHRLPMMQRANQTPAFDAVRITVK